MKNKGMIGISLPDMKFSKYHNLTPQYEKILPP